MLDFELSSAIILIKYGGSKMKIYLSLMLLLALAFQPAVLLAEEAAVPAPAAVAEDLALAVDDAKEELTEGEDWDLGLEDEAVEDAKDAAEDLKLEAPAAPAAQ